MEAPTPTPSLMHDTEYAVKVAKELETPEQQAEALLRIARNLTGEAFQLVFSEAQKVVDKMEPTPDKVEMATQLLTTRQNAERKERDEEQERQRREERRKASGEKRNPKNS